MFYEEHLERLAGCRICLYGEKEKTDRIQEILGHDCEVQAVNVRIDSYQQFVQEVRRHAKDGCSYYGMLVVDTVEKVKPYSNEISNVYKDWSCIAASEAYISNVITTFTENPRMGLAIPPVPDFGEYFRLNADGWYGHFEDVSGYLEKCGIKPNIDKKTEAMVPVGGCFWITADALMSDTMACALKTSVEDDVFLLSLVSVVQAQGAYTGVLYSDSYAEIEVTNSDYMMRELNKAVFQSYGANYHDVILDRVENNVLERELIPPVLVPEDNNWKARTKKRMKRLLPQCMYKKGKKVYFRLRGREYKE